jgi:membrane-bound lytic murein transglycosylase B
MMRMRRRHLLLTGLMLPAAALPGASRAQTQDWNRWLDGVRTQARSEGVGRAGLAALDGLRPNDRVIANDRRQAESTLTWEAYRGRTVSESRIRNGRQALAENAATFQAIAQRYSVQPRFIAAIWGMETAYGFVRGDFPVVESVATLAWEGRRAAYFRTELMAALKILDRGYIEPQRFKGSWAGAMGQPQFMPSNVLTLAVDFDGDGRRDIWESRPDVFASIANYLERRGNWRANEGWGQQVQANGAGLSESFRATRPIADWRRAGVRTLSGVALAEGPPAALIRSGEETFLVSHNHTAFRAYNNSTFYALACGLLGDAIG